MHIEGMTPQPITQEHDGLFFLYDWYQHPRDRGTDYYSSARGYRISDADIEEVLDWLNTTPPVEEAGFTAMLRELHALAPRQDRPQEYISVLLLKRFLTHGDGTPDPSGDTGPPPHGSRSGS